MATIRDVANLSGMSLGTVSNYLNGKKVSAKNAEKIEKAITELNYIPNQFGRSLRSGETKTIGIITKDISAKFISEMTATLEHDLTQRNYNVIFCNTDMDLEIEQKNLNFLIGISVDAIVIFPCDYYRTDVSCAISRNIPVILCDEDLANHSDACFKVLFKNEELAYKSTKLLIDNGHKNLACITGDRNHYATITRTIGFKRALKEYGLPYREENTLFCDYNNDLAYQKSLALFHQENHPTAVLVSSNNMLVGFLAALKELNLSPGKDVSYITFAYSDFYEIIEPHPYYVFENIEQFSYQLSELVNRILKNQYKPTNTERLFCTATIIEGDSIAKINLTSREKD